MCVFPPSLFLTATSFTRRSNMVVDEEKAEEYRSKFAWIPNEFASDDEKKYTELKKDTHYVELKDHGKDKGLELIFVNTFEKADMKVAFG